MRRGIHASIYMSHSSDVMYGLVLTRIFSELDTLLDTNSVSKSERNSYMTRCFMRLVQLDNEET